MYSVSNAYLTKMYDQVQTHKLSGTVDSIAFTDSDVVGVSYTNRCAEKKVNLGSVNIGVLKLTFLTDILNRGEYYGKTITLSDFLLTGYDGNDDPIWEEVPIGVFYIGEAKWTGAGTINITAYDCLSKLDEPVSLNQTTGTVYSFCSYVALQTGTTFGLTEGQCQALPNGTETMSLYEESNIETWRDLVSALAQMVGGFAYADRDGSWKLRSFNNTSVTSIPKNRRFSGTSVSDYETYYDTVQYTDLQSKEVRYIGDAQGLIVNLGSQPFLQYGLASTVDRRVENIIGAMKKMTYTPFDMSALPALIVLDLGDVITLSSDYTGQNSLGAVMSVTWTYNKSIKLSCYGENPNLRAGQSATDKNIAGLLNQTTNNEITYYTFANTQAVTVPDETETLIASLNFASVQQTTVKIYHEFIMDMLADLSDDCSYELKYYLNDELVAYAPYERIGGVYGASSGDTELSLTRDFFYILQNVEPGVRHNWKVALVTHGISSTELDVNHIHVTLEGQRLVGSGAFLGLIEISDTMPLFLIGALQRGAFTDSVNLTLPSNSKEEPSDAFPNFIIGGEATADYILDELGDYIRDELGDGIMSEIDSESNPSVKYADFNETMTLSLLTSMLEEGVVSNTSGYQTATFSDISSFDYVYVKVYETYGGTDYEETIGIELSDIPVSGYSFSVTLHTLVTLQITRTSIEVTQYSGGYVDIYADVTGGNDYT